MIFAVKKKLPFPDEKVSFCGCSLEKDIQSNHSKTEKKHGRLSCLIDPTRILALRKNVLLISVVEILGRRVTNHHHNTAICSVSISCPHLSGILPYELRKNSRKVQFN